MIQVTFSRVTFSQAARYVIVVQSSNQIKRTQVTEQWTSAPNFNKSLQFADLKTINVKACIANQSRTLKVIGLLEIPYDKLQGKQNILYQQDREFTQKIQGNNMCVGRCRITIRLLKSSRSSSRVSQTEQIDDQEDFQLKQQDSDNDQQQKAQMRFIIHCGINFYLGSSFAFQIKWGNKSLKSGYLKDKINPIWAENLLIKGDRKKQIQCSIVDEKNNKLDWLRLKIEDIRILYPYHLRVIFREEYVGQYPQFYLTIIREDLPLYSILQKQINLYIRPIQQNKRASQKHYIFIQASPYPKLMFPQFYQLNLKNYNSFETINKYLDNDKNWVILVPVALTRSNIYKDLSVLKSLLGRKLNIYLIAFNNWKAVFYDSVISETNIKMIDQQMEFENSLKQIYYQNEKIVIGKQVQISNADTEAQMAVGEDISDSEKWRILSHNYSLRDKMVKKSEQNIEKYKQLIKQKGQEVVQLKRVLKQVNQINKVLLQKEESALVHTEAFRERRVLKGKFEVQDIIQTLYEKLDELTKRKRINDEMRVRIASISTYEQNSEEINKTIVQNAQKLLNQQHQLKKMQVMRQNIPKQRQLIGKLQKIFQQKEIDWQLNQQLQKQSNRLKQIQSQKIQKLHKVYEKVAQHNKQSDSIKQKVKTAEEELVRLNMQYVKLQSYQ